MDQAVLVKADRDIGAKIMEALDRRRIPLNFADWTYVPQLQEWQFVISSPWVDTKGPLTTYRAVVDALEDAKIYKEVPMRRISVRSPADPLVRTLEEEAKQQQVGLIRIVKRRSQEFVAFFAPVKTGGFVPARHFADSNELESFLAEDLRMKSGEIANVLDELNSSGASAISPVSLTVRQIRKLGFN
jgi:hypothetical protein